MIDELQTYKRDLIVAHERIRQDIHNTPVMTSRLINEITGCDIYFKCENFQRMGAFKMRGALNAIHALSSKQQKRGVVTHSSGNFAQALSLAAKAIGIKAYIVMPSNAPKVKIAAVESYGGVVIKCSPTNEARERTAQDIVQTKGATFIHPSNNRDVILGQGTAAKELLEEIDNFDYLFSPVGGGGLIAGTIIAAQSFSKKTKVIGGEPFTVDDAYRSILSGKIEKNETLNTVADGLKTHLGDQNFPIIKEGIERIIRVEEAEIISAMRLIWERMKIIIEPSCAVPLAALIKEKSQFKGMKVGIILSGGNVDLDNLPF